MTREAARIDNPGVVTRLTMDNLLGKEPTVSTTFAKPRAQPNYAVGISLSRNGPNQWCPVNCICNWAVDDALDTDFAQNRHAGKRAL